MSFERRITEQVKHLSVKGDHDQSSLHQALVDIVRHLARIAAETDYHAFIAGGMITYTDCEEVTDG